MMQETRRRVSNAPLWTTASAYTSTNLRIGACLWPRRGASLSWLLSSGICRMPATIFVIFWGKVYGWAGELPRQDTISFVYGAESSSPSAPVGWRDPAPASTFTPEAIIIPSSAVNTPMVVLPWWGIIPLAPFPAPQVVVPYKDISNVSVSPEGGTERRQVRSYPGGYTGIISASRLPSTQAFDEICALLTGKIARGVAAANSHRRSPYRKKTHL